MTQKRCASCSADFVAGPARIAIGEERLSVNLDTHCPRCAATRLEADGVFCVNCGGFIPPESQVGVIPRSGLPPLICHTTYDCSPPGGTHYGYWGSGKLVSCFTTVEQC